MANSDSLSSMDTGRVVKMEVDYSSTCDQRIPECEALAASGKIHESLENLLALEKQTRTGADMISTGRVLVAIVQICFKAKKWELLNEHVTLLAKRRSQLKQAVVKMVQECCTMVDQMPTQELKVEFIKTLRNVTEGKIYVEVERARLTQKLADIVEKEGKLKEASSLMEELQVETYGSMDKREKVELMLEQMRLCFARKDLIRARIISKKINVKYFEDDSTQELKLRYYSILIDVDQYEFNHPATVHHYLAILHTPITQENPEKLHETLRNVVVFLVLSPYDNEQSDLRHRVMLDKSLEEVPLYKELLRLFINPELIKWTGLCDLYEKELRKGSVFGNHTEGDKRWADLKTRVVEHNIRIMASYYTRITLQRMGELLNLNLTETEEVLSQLVISGTVRAKTDRPTGVVHFSHSLDISDRLNEWAGRLTSLMQLVNKTTHLINKEECVHKHLLATGSNNME
uniref:Putative 26s proteasome regulatory complex subunit n=1 Tax=Xenopsylla cheopis TaxID=163159 RepID=A0A6M2DFN9_XENCH